MNAIPEFQLFCKAIKALRSFGAPTTPMHVFTWCYGYTGNVRYLQLAMQSCIRARKPEPQKSPLFTGDLV